MVGGDGNDWLYAGSGNDLVFGLAGGDRLYGESGNDVVVGGDGNDWLYGGSGRDLLFAGDGLDNLRGESHDDLLVAGSTVHDEDLEALAAILDEWASSGSYATRTSNIRIGGGAASGFALDDSTVIDDGAADSLWGNSGQDWFLSGSGDRARDKSRSELIN
jgi:Ca2+-binding RTX toxin-like protein